MAAKKAKNKTPSLNNRKRLCCTSNSNNMKILKAGPVHEDDELKAEAIKPGIEDKESALPIELAKVETQKKKIGRKKRRLKTKDENNKLKMCRLCLSTDTKMWSIHECNLDVYYTVLTGFDVSVGDGHPQHACWECAARLRSALRFRERALRARRIVASLLDTLPTDDVLEKIDEAGSDLCRSQIELYYVGEEDIDIKKYTEDISNIQDVQSPAEFEQHSGTESIDIDKSTEEGIPKLNEDLEENCIQNDPLEDETEIIKSEEVIENKLDLETNYESTIVIPKQCRKKATTKQFVITQLSLDEQLMEFQKRKQWTSYKTMRFKCDKCYKGFNHEEQFEAHQKKHTDSAGTFACAVCGLRACTQRGLRTHRKKHSHRYNCRTCPFQSFSWETAKCHNHSGKKYKCPHCFEVYDVYTSYLGHIRRTHALSEVCPRCGQAFLTALGLQLHDKLKHRYEAPAEGGPACKECGIRFASQEAFDTHLKTSAKHSSGKEAKRRTKSSSVTGKLNTNIRCELCNEQVPDSKSYAAHFREKHPGKNRTYYPSMKTPRMCDVCGKLFQSMCALSEHAAVVHTGAVRHACARCGKRLSTRHVLRAHAAAHGAGLACARCGRRLANKGNLKRHMFTVHGGERPFKCESCGKAFADNHSRKSHVEYVHNKKPWPRRDRTKRSRRLLEEQATAAAQDAGCAPGKRVMEE